MTAALIYALPCELAFTFGLVAASAPPVPLVLLGALLLLAFGAAAELVRAP